MYPGVLSIIEGTLFVLGCEEDIRGVIKMVMKHFFNEKRKRNGALRRERGHPCVKNGK